MRGWRCEGRGRRQAPRPPRAPAARGAGGARHGPASSAGIGPAGGASRGEGAALRDARAHGHAGVRHLVRREPARLGRGRHCPACPRSRHQLLRHRRQLSGRRLGDDRGGSMMRSLEQSLRRLRTEYIDVYFNHAVNDVERLKNPEWHEFTARAKQQGKIRFVGMSGHAGRLIQCLDYALDTNGVDVILVAYNFGQDPAFYQGLTRSFDFIARQADLPRVLQKAKAKGVGVVAMKTLMGARLNDMRPFEKDGATFAQAAFRWVLSGRNVDALIISMTSGSTIDEYLGASGWQSAASDDLPLLQRYVKVNGASQCRHGCQDCLSACPNGVQIGEVLRTRMYAVDYGDLTLARSEYAMLSHKAAPCLTCAAQPCRIACSHGLTIERLTGPTHRMLKS